MTLESSLIPRHNEHPFIIMLGTAFPPSLPARNMYHCLYWNLLSHPVLPYPVQQIHASALSIPYLHQCPALSRPACYFHPSLTHHLSLHILPYSLFFLPLYCYLTFAFCRFVLVVCFLLLNHYKYP